MNEPTLINACAGKSRSAGGLNIPEFKQALMRVFPDASNEIRAASRRADLHRLCQTLSARYLRAVSSVSRQASRPMVAQLASLAPVTSLAPEPQRSVSSTASVRTNITSVT
jgi:hypothetical protein